MRFTSGLLAALAAGSAVAQFANTTSLVSSAPLTTTTISDESTAAEATTTTSSAEASSSAGPPVEVSLGSASLGPGASFVTGPDGKTAVQLSAPANGQASFGVAASELPQGVTVGDLIKLLFELLVSLLENGRKRATTDCTLDVLVNGVSVLTQTLQTTSGFSQVTTGNTPAAANQNIQFVQKCGANPATMQVANLAVGSPSNSGGSTTTPGGGGSVTASQTGNSTTSATQTGGGSGSATGSLTASGSATGTATGSSASSSATGTVGFPSNIDGFALYGCVRSTANFPTFSLVRSSSSMSLDQCAAFCRGRAFFGVNDNDCYCGDSIDSAISPRVNIEQCSITCPGNPAEFCGGFILLSSRDIQARQVASNILLTVYISTGGNTATTTSVVTSTFTQTVTGVSTTATQTVTAIYNCFNGQCFPSGGNGGVTVYIFNSFPGASCDGQTVYIMEDCTCAGGKKYVPKYCSNGSCAGLVVYKPQACSDWWNQQNYFVPANCDTCAPGTVVYTPWENNMGTPAQPVVAQVPACSGSGCLPISQPAVTTPGVAVVTGGSYKPAGSNTPAVVVGAGSKQAASAIAYVAAFAAALL